MHVRWSLLVALCLAACPKAQTPAPPASSALSCGEAIPGIEARLQPGSLTLFGEMHGTQEAPAFVARAACQAAQRGPVVVAVELPTTEQARVSQFLSSDGGDTARKALLAGEFWTRAYQDGRSSEAMFSLLSSLREWRAAGASLEVVCIDVPQDQMRQARDERMGENLVRAVREHPRAVVFSLTGNIHSRTKQGTPWDSAFLPMGWHAQQQVAGLVSVDLLPAGGEAWMCFSDKAEECGPNPLGVPPSLSAPGEISWFSTPDERGYSGVVNLGPTLTARPATQNPPQP